MTWRCGVAHADAKTKARGGVRESADPRLKFSEAADRWLAEQVVTLRPSTRAGYRSYVENHLRPRWGGRRLDAIDVTDAAALVRELRAAGLAEWTISGICRAANRVFKFARRHCAWRGDNPFAELEKGERPRVSSSPERRIYVGGELAQVLAASTEPWRTLFRLASVVGGRESELLGLWWQDLDLRDLGAATIRFGFQADRDGNRVELKTEESKATLPLPRSAALMLLEHKARTPAPTRRRRLCSARGPGDISGSATCCGGCTALRSVPAPRMAYRRSRSCSSMTSAASWSSTSTETSCIGT
jgi:integrase